MSSQDVSLGAELSNRREIPVTSFDFLDGAYKKAINARRTVIGAASVMTTAALALAAMTVPVWNSGTQAQSDREVAVERRGEVFDALGRAPGTAVAPEALILNYRSLLDTHGTLLLRSPTLSSVLDAIVGAGDGMISSVRVGYADDLIALVPGTPGDPTTANHTGLRPRIVVTLRGESIGDAVLAAGSIRNAGLEVTFERREGIAGVTVGAVESSLASPAIARQIEDMGLLLTRSLELEKAKEE